MTKKKVLIACGTGVATSTLVFDAVKEIANKNNIDVDLIKIKIADIDKHPDADLLITTARTDSNLNFPVIKAQSFLTGIGVEDTKKQILKELGK